MITGPTAIGFQDGDDEFLTSHVGTMVNMPDEHCSCGFVGRWHPHFEAEAKQYILDRRERQRQRRWAEEWKP